jgi:hypothetical protein
LEWQRGESKLKWRNQLIAVPHPLLWAAELADGNGVAVVTLFDERTPRSEPNAFVYRPDSGFVTVSISEDGAPVRMLGCYVEGGSLVFNAANEFEYVLNPNSLEVISRRYYR